MTLEIPYRLANGAGNPPDARKFMADYDWLTALIAGDFLVNGGFEKWNAATSFTNPAHGTLLADSWYLRKTGTSGATANVAREATTIDAGTYSASIVISVAGTADSIYAFDQTLSGITNLQGKTLAFGMMVRAATASKVRLKITDGTSTVYSSYHTGGDTFEHLNGVITVSASATSVVISMEITSDFTGTIYVDSGYIYSVPSQMTSAARAFLAWSPLLSRASETDFIFVFGTGPVVIDRDGSGRMWRLEVENGIVGATQV